MAVKASVDTQNQTTVRVGQQNAIRVSSTAAGISGADTATTAVNVVGGRADVTQLAVSGLSTFTGIGTFVSDLYVGGDLYLTDDLVLDNISGSSLIISGISSLGITSATDLEAQQLSVSGISTFNDDVVFKGDTSNAKWDSSTNDLILFDDTRLEFGSNKDFEIWHGGSHTFVKNTGGDLRIRGDKILLKRENDEEKYLVGQVQDGRREVLLYYNNVQKLATTLHGVEVTGLTSTTDVLVSGAVTATSYYGDGTNLTGIAVTGGDNTFSNIDVSGITTTSVLKIGTAITASGGIITATSFYGDGTNLTGVARTDNINADSLYVSGISTFAGITTVTGHTLFTKQLSVSGLSTYIGVATYKDDVFIDGTLTAGVIDGGTY